MPTENMKEWIDNASYETLLTHWRFAPAGDLFFAGEVGEYYNNVMSKEREKIGNEEHVKISKRVGW